MNKLIKIKANIKSLRAYGIYYTISAMRALKALAKNLRAMILN